MRRTIILMAIGVLLVAPAAWPTIGRASAAPSLASAAASVQPKMVKIFGAGGIRGLEAYQSGFLISAEGHVLTVWSHVLDTDYLVAVLNDGQRFEAKVLGADPELELAVLKIDATELDYFALDQSTSAVRGARVMAFSNLYGVATGDEPASVQRGIVVAKTLLDARHGVFETPYRGPVYVVDAVTNNPGVQGGALTDHRGRLLGMLGKELRNAVNSTWLNYAIPIDELRASVDAIRAGKSRPQQRPAEERRPADGWKLADLGLLLVPDVLERTPPYVEDVRAGSPAAAAGVRRDDLVVFVGEQLVQSCRSFVDEIVRIEPEATVKLVLLRGQELVTVEINPLASEGQP